MSDTRQKVHIPHTKMSNKSTQKERKQEKEKKIICLLVLPDKEQMLCTRSQSETFTLYTLRSQNVKHRADSFEIWMQKATHKTHAHKKQQQQSTFFEETIL